MKKKLKNFFQKYSPLFVFLTFFFSFFILTVFFVTKKSLFAYFNSPTQSERSLASQKKSNLKMDFEKVKEFLRFSVERLRLEKSPYYVTVKIPRGRNLCKYFSRFKMDFVAKGISINGDQPQISVHGSCFFNKDVLTQIPLHYQKQRSFIEYDLKTSPNKSFYTYKDWYLKEIIFLRQNESDHLSVPLGENFSFKL